MAAALVDILKDVKTVKLPKAKKPKAASAPPVATVETAAKADATPPAPVSANVVAVATPDATVAPAATVVALATVDTAASGDATMKTTTPRTHAGRGPVQKPVEGVVAEATAKPVASPQKQVWENIGLGRFLDLDSDILEALMAKVVKGGKVPVVCFEIDVAGAYSRVDFKLSTQPGHGDEPRIQLTAVGGEGQPSVLFAKRVFFRDEIFGHAEVPPARQEVTRGLRGHLEMVLSILAAQSAQ